MNAFPAPETRSTATASISPRPRYARPIWTLLLLAPFIGEVLSGSTRTSILFVFIPEVMVWGIGALYCRELTRRWRAGSVSLLFLGMALSVAEEFLIQQTSLAPLPFPGAHWDYGRIWGINLVYLLFMLGYESVWIVLVPVQVTELLFPRKASEPWLRPRGTIAACIFFLLGCRVAWYGWTQKARPRMGAAAYHPPLSLLALGVVAILALIAAAYLTRNVWKPAAQDHRHPAPLWLVGLAAFLMGSAWFNVIGQIFIPKPVQPFCIVIAAGCTWAALAFVLFVWWSSRATWTRAHGFASAFGATLACMATPYLTIASWPKVDVIGKIIFDVLALVGFYALARKVFVKANPPALG